MNTGLAFQKWQDLKGFQNEAEFSFILFIR